MQFSESILENLFVKMMSHLVHLSPPPKTCQEQQQRDERDERELDREREREQSELDSLPPQRSDRSRGREGASEVEYTTDRWTDGRKEGGTGG